MSDRHRHPRCITPPSGIPTVATVTPPDELELERLRLDLAAAKAENERLLLQNVELSTAFQLVHRRADELANKIDKMTAELDKVAR